MNQPLVSVVMPVYNGERYLKEAIESVLFQSYKNLELIVVDDGSVDASKSIILSYPDARIRLVENTKNSGIVYTRNKGLSAATGEYVATLDCDDIALPDRLEKQVNFLEQNPDHALCGSFFQIMDADGRLSAKMEMPTCNRDIVTYLTVGNCYCNSTIMVRGKLAKELKYTEGYDIVEDYELWYRISRRTKIAILPFLGTYYRVHGNNISVSKMNDMFSRVKRIYARVLTDSSVRFSERELELHANWLNGNFSFFNSRESMLELAAWSGKFYTGICGNVMYNPELLYELISEKWLYILFKTKHFGLLFRNGLFSINRRQYLKCLSLKMFKKFRYLN